MIKTFLNSRKHVPNPQSLQEYNSDLEKADEEIESGDYTTHEEVLKRYQI